MRVDRASTLLALLVLFTVLAVSFVNIPWSSGLHEVPVTSEPGGSGVADSLFNQYGVTVILIALVLSAAMIGGVYLAKMEGKL